MTNHCEIRRVTLAEAKRLLDGGYRYLDVRTETEFALGHPVGAVNVPFSISDPSGTRPNPDFVSVVERGFDKLAGVVVGCQSGKRSLPAARALAVAGYRDVVEMAAGFGGTRNAFGQLLEQGWEAAGLPTACGADAGSYDALRTRLGL